MTQNSTNTREQTKNVGSWKNKLTHRYTLAIATTLLALLAIVSIGTISHSSLPGEKLYIVKLNGVEKFLSFIHLTHKSKAQFQVTLLQDRLDEVKVLATKTEISEVSLNALRTQTTKQTEVFVQLINESIDSAFPKTEVLKTVNEYATIATAIENIAENNTVFGTYGDTAEDVRQNAVNLYKEKAHSFAATENQNDIYIYIGSRLLEVTDALEVATLNADSTKSVKLYLDRVEPALRDKDFGKVLIAIAEAERYIRVVSLGGEDILDAIAYPEKTKTSTLEIMSDTATATTTQ